MDKKRYIIQFIVVLVLIVAVSSVPAVVAYMLRQSDPMENTFVPAQVSARVNVTSSTASVEVNNQDETQTTISSVTVTNTSNIDVYVRVRVVTYWQDSKGNVVARNSPDLGLADKCKEANWTYQQKNETNRETYSSANWIYDVENQTFYYKKSLTTDGDTATTGKLLQSSIVLETVTENQNGIKYTYHPVVEFVVEAIQSSPDTAVKEKWKVTLETNGNIKEKTSTTQ